MIVVRCVTCRGRREGFIHRSYGRGEIEAIAAYCADVDRCHLLPPQLAVEREALRLRLAPSRNNQWVGVNWAREFEFGATLRRQLGPIAQLGERLHGMQEAGGSSPPGSTFEPSPERGVAPVEERQPPAQARPPPLR